MTEIETAVLLTTVMLPTAAAAMLLWVLRWVLV